MSKPMSKPLLIVSLYHPSFVNLDQIDKLVCKKSLHLQNLSSLFFQTIGAFFEDRMRNTKIDSNLIRRSSVFHDSDISNRKFQFVTQASIAEFLICET